MFSPKCLINAEKIFKQEKIMVMTDWVDFDGSKERCVNLSASVGKGGKNMWQDVMLIQALFNYLYQSHRAAALHLPKNVFPKDTISEIFQMFPVTGNIDAITLQTITSFQAINRKHILNADGRIEPAHYKGRVIKGNTMTQPLMTITYLHVLAKQVERRAEAKRVQRATKSIHGSVGKAIVGGVAALVTVGFDYIDKLKIIAPELPLY
jgi:hypothetical protein